MLTFSNSFPVTQKRVGQGMIKSRNFHAISKEG